MYSIEKIKSVLGIESSSQGEYDFIHYLSIDTRKINDGIHTLFFCLPGSNRDGHDYIGDAYIKGVRWMVVSRSVLPVFDGLNYLVVPDVTRALQAIARYKRKEAKAAEIIGLTGSNAKTIIKEWLFQMCHPPLKVIRSPKSFNSQLGVALSLWQLKEDTDLGIIEAGISTSGEMEILADIIEPTIGIFTNIGDAHSAGFLNVREKIAEKSKLFKSARKIIVHSGHHNIYDHLVEVYGRERLITWGTEKADDFCITKISDGHSLIKWADKELYISTTDRSQYAFENLIHTVVTSIYLGIDLDVIESKIPLLENLEMRLEHIPGKDGSLVINDAYIADVASLEVAIDHLANISHQGPTTVILSDFYDQKSSEPIYQNIHSILSRIPIDRLITVGSFSGEITLNAERMHFNTTEELLNQLESIEWTDHLVLIKGSRKFRLDRIVGRMERASHSAYLEIDIPALHHNISEIRNHLPTGCGFIAVIKASAYGAGIEKVASAISDHSPSYFSVAYADEGIKLRNYGISQPIIILNPDEDKTEILFNHNLEPVVHNFSFLRQLSRTVEKLGKEIKIHIKLDTGMHRLGFSLKEIDPLILQIKKEERIKVSTIFSHLSASESPKHDQFTKYQAELFDKWSDMISNKLGYIPMKHLLNSEGIWRFPEYAYDLVRAGITMYGISEFRKSLKKVHSLNAKIISINQIKKGESIGYGRSEFLEKDKKIGVINIGYSDGLMRSGSNRKISVFVNGQLCPIVGKICMDVAMIDLDSVETVEIGDNAEIFGEKIPIEKHAQQCKTVPYEILCNISPRIVRRYIMD